MADLIPGSTGPLLPLWTVFLLFFSFYGLSTGLDSLLSVSRLPMGLCRALIGLGLGCRVVSGLIFGVWLHFYAQRFALFEPAWFYALGNDLGQSDEDMQIVVLICLLCMLAWLSYRTIGEKTRAALLLSKGTPLMVILTVIGLLEGLLRSNSYTWQVALLLPLFYWLGLGAQALQKASTKRRHHAGEALESASSPERIILQIMGLLALVLICAALFALVVHGDLTIHIPQIHPFELLAPANGSSDKAKALSPPRLSHTSPGLPALFGAIWIIIILIFLSAGLLIYLSLSLWQKRKRRVRRKREHRDERKSL
ncbi:MAG TPA: hypothetical protein VGD98_14310 [Ktedonobacteraceae bacterium]